MSGFRLGLTISGFIWLTGDMLMGLSRADRHLEYAIASAAVGLGLIIVGSRVSR